MLAIGDVDIELAEHGNRSRDCLPVTAFRETIGHKDSFLEETEEEKFSPLRNKMFSPGRIAAIVIVVVVIVILILAGIIYYFHIRHSGGSDGGGGSNGNIQNDRLVAAQSNQSLSQGSSLSAGPYNITMQTDGNLCLYDNSQINPAIWCSETSGKGTPPYQLVMQTDGNLCINDSSQSNPAIWCSESSGKGSPPYTAILQFDRNFVIYDTNATSIWSTKTTRS